MKNLLFAVALLSYTFSFGQEDPVILTINEEEVHQSEFMYIYTKNNPNPSFANDSLDDYMKLFINYKLKVMEARRMQYDTIPRLVTELAQYRDQLSLPYMVDQEMNETLIKEAYDRTVNEVKASHILVNIPKNATPEDTLNAYNRILKLRDRVVGGEDFASVAKSKGGSDDPSAKKNGGNLGYFTAFQMVYPFEEAAFTTAVGEISMPIKTRFGYHIVWVEDKRPALGKVQAAHIMIMDRTANPNDEVKNEAKEKIDEIYAELQGGAPFEELAKKYSEDNSSKNKGGMLPLFGAGTKQRMVPEFEEAVYHLKNDGEYSKPFKTTYGWHIVKRVTLSPIASYDDMHRELKLKVERDIRAKSTQASFINSLKKDYKFHEHTEYLSWVTAQMTDEVYSGRWAGLKGADTLKQEIMSFAGKEYTLGDFNEYIMRVQGKERRKSTLVDYTNALYGQWVNNEIKAYEDTQLESKYPAFKSLIQEYRDGILVFEIMQNEIWNKASKDSSGIQKYYEDHRGDFTYPTRYDGVLYKCKDKETAGKVLDLVKADTLKYGEIQNIVNEDSKLNCLAKKHVFNSETTESFKIYKKGKLKGTRKFKAGINKTYEYNDEYYIMVVKEVLEPRNREFHEAKGLVTAAYQNQMEQEWLASLRNTYKIDIKTDVLYSLKDKN
ncbi:MAG: peptidylprolyl isomerase [Flavobacteriales bacterium]|nr:peptidylprolyl isomerase [Flavobacteriales bacterium]